MKPYKVIDESETNITYEYRTAYTWTLYAALLVMVVGIVTPNELLTLAGGANRQQHQPVLFEQGGGFSGRLVLAARRGFQEVVGWWIWDQPRDDAVKGRFTTLNRERVVFEGSWMEYAIRLADAEFHGEAEDCYKLAAVVDVVAQLREEGMASPSDPRNGGALDEILEVIYSESACDRSSLRSAS